MLKKILLIGATVAALAACGAMPSGNAAGSTAEVAAAAEKLRVAMVDPDRATLSALVSDELTYGHSGGKLDTKESFIADLLNGNSDFVTIAINDQSVKVLQNVGLVRHTLSAQTNDGGKPGSVTIKILQVWQQQGGAWKLIARQAVRPQ